MTKIESKIKEKYQWVSIAGNIDLNNIHDFQKELTAIIAESEKHIVLDTASLEHIEASGIGAFVSLQKKMILANREMAFVNVSLKLEQALDMAGIKSFFNLYKSEEDVPW